MKKKSIIMIILVLLVIIGIFSIYVYKNIQKNDRKYDIENIDISEYQYFALKQDSKYGVLNKNGDVIIKPEYTNIVIPNPKKDVFVCYNDENTKVLNQNGEELWNQYEKIAPIKLKNIANNLMYEKNILTYEKDGKIGLINIEGKNITKPIYESIEGLPYKEGELLVKQNGKYGVLNNKGKYLVHADYDQILVDNYNTEKDGYKNAGYIISNTTDNGYRYGYMDVNGKVILKPEYNEISRIVDINDEKNVYLIAAENGQYGMFKNDEQIIKNEYQSISYNSENNTLILEKTKKFGVATIDGKIIIPIEYSQIDSTGEYIYATDKDSNVQVYQEDGTKASVDSNIYLTKTTNDNYKIKIDNSQGSKYTITDKNGKELTKDNYTYIEYLYDDYFIVSIAGGKVGVINIKEEPIIDIKYNSIEKIQDTDYIVTRLTESNTTQLYNKKLEMICEMSGAVIDKKNNYIKIYNDEETKYFDMNGKEIENTKVLPEQNIYAKEQNGKWGFVDKNGKVVVDYKYEKVTDLNSYGYAGIKENGKWGVIDSNGKVVLQPKYEFNVKTEPEFIKQYYKVEYGYGEFYYTNQDN